ncbi:MAG: tetratricopeptide repeat protein [Candidatus Omnitrophota bacterium]
MKKNILFTIAGLILFLAVIFFLKYPPQTDKSNQFNPAAKTLCESAVSYMEKGDFTIAIENLKKAIKIDPRYPKPEYALAVCYLRMEPPDLNAAKEHYEKSKGLGYHPPEWFERHLRKLEGKEK